MKAPRGGLDAGKHRAMAAKPQLAAAPLAADRVLVEAKHEPDLDKRLQDQLKQVHEELHSSFEVHREGLRQDLCHQLEQQVEKAVMHAEQLAEERSCAIEHAVSQSSRGVEEVWSELRAFIDEQRIFCGFLDTEQRSHQELVRAEVGALSRLVESLRCDSHLADSGFHSESRLLGDSLHAVRTPGRAPVPRAL